MHRIGLHGKSFIPLIMGFGCNVPAIMATRTIESRSSRLITVLLVPFMSCSARIPIYILLIGTFFAAYASWVMLGLYLLGIVVAVITARLMRRYLFKKDETPFVMELPPYRVPTMRATLSHMWDRCAQYLRKMGGLILVASVAVWFLSYYPTPDAATPAETTEEHYENSYLGQVGQACSPVFEPLGLNWKASIAILTGLPAKEIVVSTLGVLYSEQGDAPEAELDSPALSQRLVASGDFTPASALAFLVFILLYLPCIATGIILGNKKEQVAKFSFLMVLIPILGEALLELIDMLGSHTEIGISTSALIAGFLGAFLAGCVACKFMINLVKNGKLIYFAIYCAIIGTGTIIFSLI
jgi:ferrous iron transport protein B